LKFRVRVLSQSGSAGLGFQTGNLRSRFPAPFIPFKVADPRPPSLALSCATENAASTKGEFMPEYQLYSFAQSGNCNRATLMLKSPLRWCQKARDDGRIRVHVPEGRVDGCTAK
jgi:hypothetical protein